MTFGARFLAVDWGTTNRRVFLIENSCVVRSERDGRGVTAIEAGGFPAEVAAIRARFGDLPMLLAGMVGSTLGWREAPYISAPVGVAGIARSLVFVDARTAIVPGVSILAGGRADVMRGEEVQVLGAIAGGSIPADALLCLPGTHCKWVTLEDGRIVRFTTAMTGELFALLRTHSVLGKQLARPAMVGAAFHAGVEEARRGDLLAALFGIRAAVLLGVRDDDGAASYASGLLIGCDVAARLADAGARPVHILADPSLAALYAAAIAALGGEAIILDGDGAFAAGIIQIERQLA